jgi:hypothetical protein
MMNVSGNALDQYIGMADGAIAGSIEVKEWIDVFAPDAVIRGMGPEPIRGRDAITNLYSGYVASFIEAKHLWSSSVLPDGTVRASWAAAVRLPDGTVTAAAGVETAKVDASGKITELLNEFTIPPAEG